MVAFAIFVALTVYRAALPAPGSGDRPGFQDASPLQEADEAYFIGLFEDTNLCDIQLARRIREQIFKKGSLQSHPFTKWNELSSVVAFMLCPGILLSHFFGLVKIS